MTLVLPTCAGATELKLTASDRAAADFFGQSVSISGDYAAVVSEMTAPTEGVTPAKPGGWGLPGFTAVFAIVVVRGGDEIRWHCGRWLVG
ncbi:MAG: FG-GAP repeat protein [Methanosarcinales archaeon]|nr:FG-GAP repeat protein [Methanosarcinales archaeon]